MLQEGDRGATAPADALAACPGPEGRVASASCARDRVGCVRARNRLGSRVRVSCGSRATVRPPPRRRCRRRCRLPQPSRPIRGNPYRMDTYQFWSALRRRVRHVRRIRKTAYIGPKPSTRGAPRFRCVRRLRPRPSYCNRTATPPDPPSRPRRGRPCRSRTRLHPCPVAALPWLLSACERANGVDFYVIY